MPLPESGSYGWYGESDGRTTVTGAVRPRSALQVMHSDALSDGLWGPRVAAGEARTALQPDHRQGAPRTTAPDRFLAGCHAPAPTGSERIHSRDMGCLGQSAEFGHVRTSLEPVAFARGPPTVADPRLARPRQPRNSTCCLPLLPARTGLYVPKTPWHPSMCPFYLHVPATLDVGSYGHLNLT